MKKSFKFAKSLLAIALVFVICTLCACKKSQTKYYSYYEDVSDTEYSSNTVDNNNDVTGNNNVTDNNNNNVDDGKTSTPSNKNPSSKVDGSSSGNKKFDLKNIPSSLKGSTVFVYSWNDASAVSGAESVIESFENSTGIKVKWQTGSYDNYSTEIAALVSSGKAPDVIRLKNMDHAILSLMDPLVASGYDFSDDIWDKNVLNYYTIYDYAYAVNRQNTLIQQPHVVFYNTKTIKQYNFEDPYELWKKGKWTWDKFYEMIKEFHDETGYYSWSPHYFFEIMYMNGTSLVKRDGNKYVNNTSDKNIVQGLSKMVNMINDGYVDPVDINYNGFPAGKNLFMSTSCIGGRRTHFYFTTVKEDNSIAMVPYPTITGQKYYQLYSEYEAYGIAKGAKNAKAVPYFLAYYLDGSKYDQNTFFPNVKMLEVYKWCRQQENVFVTPDPAILTADSGVHYRNDVALPISRLKNSSDVPTLINSVKSSISSSVKYANNKLSKLDLS